MANRSKRGKKCIAEGKKKRENGAKEKRGKERWKKVVQ